MTYKGDEIVSIMMTNKLSLVNVTKENFYGQSASDSKPVEIALESILGAVSVDDSELNLDNSQAIKLLQGGGSFVVSNIAKASYLLRHTKGPSLPKAVNQTEELEGQYAYSVGYENIALASDDEIKQTEKNNYIAAYQEDKTFIQHLISVENANNYAYVKETTVDPKHYWVSLVPHIIIAYPIAPAGLDVTPNKGWIRYKNVPMKEEDFTAYVTALRENAQAIPEVNMPDGFKESVRKILNNPLVTEMNAPFSLEGIDFFYKSLNFYAWPIRHFNDSVAPEKDSFGRYGVVRNNEYKIKVKKISWFGSNLPLHLVNRDELIVEQSPITLSITVTPSDKREQEVAY